MLKNKTLEIAFYLFFLQASSLWAHSICQLMQGQDRLYLGGLLALSSLSLGGLGAALFLLKADQS
ncbi:MAG: hypothetical protein SOR40_03145 [Rothia sp. (in: high G+C Gram-positive bacteria)]|nr:hypothetical protein [Rothia sp. (in: high G+C Gram-positive bacteria)]